MKPSNTPKATLYLRNLNDKINKNLLKETLYLLFSQYGTVIDIVALKTMKMRGQAFICFSQLQEAMNAYQQLQDKSIFGKPVKIEYSQQNSSKLDVYNGNYVLKEESDVDMDMEDIEFSSNVLYVKNLPSDASDDMLALLFQQYEGFIQVRLVPGKTDVAYIDYQTEDHAKTAKAVLNNFLITKNKPMHIEFAK